VREPIEAAVLRRKPEQPRVRQERPRELALVLPVVNARPLRIARSQSEDDELRSFEMLFRQFRQGPIRRGGSFRLKAEATRVRGGAPALQRMSDCSRAECGNAWP
jgi:hypothetical protein